MDKETIIVYASNGDEILQVNMAVYEKYLEKSNYFICDKDGNPLEPDVINEAITVEEVPEIETPAVEAIKVPEVEVIETPAVEDVIPEERLCPHCGSRARTDISYINNHGKNCSMYVA